MAHAYITLQATAWAKFLEHFKNTISYLALNDGMDETTVAALIEQYTKGINGHREHIFEHIARDIVAYINFYNVAPKEGIYDEFKGIYFTGMVVSKYLVGLGLVDLNKLHLRAVLRLLDYRLKEPYGANRPVLSERIRSIIDNNVIESHLGKYGWYLIYKCLYNAANPNSKTV